MTAEMTRHQEAFAALRESRASDPDAISRAAAGRTRRTLVPPGGTLLIVAADHPARGALRVGTRADAMADRYDLLERLLTCLAHPRVDGVLATADIVDDLLLLGALEGRVVIGSMNRGGLQGSTFEMDDRITGYDPASLLAQRFDGGKMLVRIDPHDPSTVVTLESAGRAVTALDAAGLMAMIEPFWRSRAANGRSVTDLSTAAVIRSVAVASGLGACSAHTWLKLPVVAAMASVMAATTLPTVILGGDGGASTEANIDIWGRALALPGVRGLVVGRALLYPADDDVASAVAAAARMLG